MAGSRHTQSAFVDAVFEIAQRRVVGMILLRPAVVREEDQRIVTESPTIIVGNIGLETSSFCGDGPEGVGELQRRFDRGEFDLAAIGRPLIPEPEWCNKIRDGHPDTILDFTKETRDTYP